MPSRSTCSPPTDRSMRTLPPGLPNFDCSPIKMVLELLKTANDNCSSIRGTPCLIWIRSVRILVRHETAEVGRMRHGTGEQLCILRGCGRYSIFPFFFFFTKEHPWSSFTHQTGFLLGSRCHIFVGRQISDIGKVDMRHTAAEP